ncbi:hypothetical protein J6590_015521 [Homalodisca vitripennis]|nr:hypothetical protein J6590_015521 [Homalodisca vitripennis]
MYSKICINCSNKSPSHCAHESKGRFDTTTVPVVVLTGSCDLDGGLNELRRDDVLTLDLEPAPLRCLLFDALACRLIT